MLMVGIEAELKLLESAFFLSSSRRPLPRWHESRGSSRRKSTSRPIPSLARPEAYFALKAARRSKSWTCPNAVRSCSFCVRAQSRKAGKAPCKGRPRSTGGMAKEDVFLHQFDYVYSKSTRPTRRRLPYAVRLFMDQRIENVVQ